MDGAREGADSPYDSSMIVVVPRLRFLRFFEQQRTGRTCLSLQTNHRPEPRFDRYQPGSPGESTGRATQPSQNDWPTRRRPLAVATRRSWCLSWSRRSPSADSGPEPTSPSAMRTLRHGNSRFASPAAVAAPCFMGPAKSACHSSRRWPILVLMSMTLASASSALSAASREPCEP